MGRSMSGHTAYPSILQQSYDFVNLFLSRNRRFFNFVKFGWFERNLYWRFGENDQTEIIRDAVFGITVALTRLCGRKGSSAKKGGFCRYSANEMRCAPCGKCPEYHRNAESDERPLRGSNINSVPTSPA